MPKTIVIGADHAGFDLKEILKTWLSDSGWSVVDVGCYSLDRVDYPHISQAAVQVFQTQKLDWGLLVCGSGVGVGIAANRFFGIRAVTTDNVTIARLSREHNKANILCLGARMTAAPLAVEILETFLNTAFEGDRHASRIAQLDSPFNHLESSASCSTT